MNNIFSTLTIALLLTACGQKREENYSVPSEFAVYVEAFKEEARLQGKNLEITNLEVEYGDLTEYSSPGAFVVGLCIKYENDALPPKIIIQEADWNRQSEKFRVALFFHEMGHCILNRPHRAEFHPQYNIPVSVMNPFVITNYIHRSAAHFDVYMQELFNPQVNIMGLIASIYNGGTVTAALSALSSSFSSDGVEAPMVHAEHNHDQSGDCVKYITEADLAAEQAAEWSNQ